MSIPSFLNIVSRGYSDYLNKPIPDPAVAPNDIQSREALLAAQKALHDQILAQVGQAPMQMPSVQPNKGLAIGGGILALIGALTGDKYAQGGFQQFMGGLNQAAQSDQQRLLQQEMLKRQQKERDDALILKTLGMDVETAADQYRQDMLLAQSKAEADARARREAQEYQRDVQKLGIQQKYKMALEGTKATNAQKLALIRSVPGKEREISALVARGISEFDALDIVYERTLDEARRQKILADTEFAKNRPDLMREGWDAAQKRAETAASAAAKRQEASLSHDWRKTQYLEQGRMERDDTGSSVNVRLNRDPQWTAYNTEEKGQAARAKALRSKIAAYEKELAKIRAEDPEFEYGPDPIRHRQYMADRQELAKVSKRLADLQVLKEKRRKAILGGAESGYSPIAPQIGTSDPSMSGAIRPIR